MGIIEWLGRFGRSRRLFNQASDHWRSRQRFLLDGNDEQARKACVEVIRLCQQGISFSPKNGNAYVLLANALSSAASEIPKHAMPDRYEFLQSRAASVIHFWYSLPHRGYTITTNTAIAQRLWAIILDEIKQDRGLSESEAITIMDSYRDQLAADTVSTSSFSHIEKIICTEPTKNQRLAY